MNNDVSTPQEKHSSHVDPSFWIGLFLGGLIGAVTIVLLGTDKGRKLAKKLQVEGLDIWNDAKDTFDEKKEQVTDVVIEKKQAVEEKLQELEVQLKDQIEKRSQELAQMKQELEEKKREIEGAVTMKVETLEEKGEDLIEKGRQLIREGKVMEEKAIEKMLETKDDLSEKTLAKADQALAHLEQVQERGRASTAELRKRLFKNIPKK